LLLLSLPFFLLINHQSKMVNALSVCFSVLFLSNLALAARGGSHIISNKRGGHGRVVQSYHRRAAVDHALAEREPDFAPPARRKRSFGRCNSNSSTTVSSVAVPATTVITSSSATHAASTTELIGNPGGDPTTTKAAVTTSTSTPEAPETTRSIASTTKEVEQTTTKQQPTITTKAAVKATTTSTKAAATTSASSGGGDGGSGTTYSGQGTYYGTGLGACGITNHDTDMIAAVSHLLFDSWPGATANPNDNPICGRKATAHYQGKSVTVTITDRCVGCKTYDLDFSPSAFSDLADQSLGRIDITWQWDE